MESKTANLEESRKKIKQAFSNMIIEDLNKRDKAFYSSTNKYYLEIINTNLQNILSNCPSDVLKRLNKELNY